MIDLASDKGAHVDRRLRADQIVWVGTVRADGRPHAVPVWFWWDGDAILIFTKADSQKARNLSQNPNVVLALDDTKGAATWRSSRERRNSCRSHTLRWPRLPISRSTPPASPASAPPPTN